MCVYIYVCVCVCVCACACVIIGCDNLKLIVGACKVVGIG
jgi:hypothetical protein